MTKKEISVKLGQFIKEHKPDEFKSSHKAIHSFLNSLFNQGGNRSVRRATYSKWGYEVARWWWAGKRPMSESAILSSMDTEYVTHNRVRIYACGEQSSWITSFPNSNIIDVMFKLSFKYNIISVEQTDCFEMWLKESEDHQTNISGEVVEKIAKCLEY